MTNVVTMIGEIGCFESMTDFVATYADNIATSKYNYGYSIEHIIDAVGVAFDDKLTHDQIEKKLY